MVEREVSIAELTATSVLLGTIRYYTELKNAIKLNIFHNITN